MELLDYSERIKSTADKFLKEIGLIKYLKNHGKVTFTGSYAANIMYNRDIDIYVTKNSEFRIEEFVEIFKEVFMAKITPGIHCGNEIDFTNPRYTFPKGFYMGIKSNYNLEKWKIDIWFIHEAELSKIKYTDLRDRLNENNRELILQIKKYVNDHNLKISSVGIYDRVFIDKVNSLEMFIENTDTL